MLIPNWAEDAVLALYGEDHSAWADTDNSCVTLLREYTEPIWPMILGRFDGTPRPEPIILPVDSPAGSPTTLSHQGTEVLVFDEHLLQLIVALTIMTDAGADAKIFVPAVASIYAERLVCAGRIEAATLFGAGSRLAVASSPSIATSGLGNLMYHSCLSQLAFVVAHELAHLAFAEYPDRVQMHADDHRRLLRDCIQVTSSETARLDETEAALARMEQLGYSPSARTRYFDELEETRQAITALEAWDLVSSDKEFMIEVMADHMACTTLFRSHRLDHDPVSLAVAASLAVHNLFALQYMDVLASGSHPESLADDPHSYLWQTASRGLALRHSIAIQAVSYANDGEPKYHKGTLLQIDRALNIVGDRFEEHIMDPLIFAIDFEELGKGFEADETVTSIARGVGRRPSDVRQFLGFGRAKERAAFTKYVNVVKHQPTY